MSTSAKKLLVSSDRTRHNSGMPEVMVKKTPVPLVTLKKRAEFLRIAAVKRKWVTPGMIVQIAPAETVGGIGFGLTASKKVGMAVTRNRAKRRLRALVREILPAARTDLNYVLIARPETATRDYADLRKDLLTALRRLDALQEKS